jgi:DNA mismatch repair ATPase MutS
VSQATNAHLSPPFVSWTDVFRITFLYKLTEGAAKKSYGLNVARLAEVQDANIIFMAECVVCNLILALRGRALSAAE